MHSAPTQCLPAHPQKLTPAMRRAARMDYLKRNQLRGGAGARHSSRLTRMDKIHEVCVCVCSWVRM